MRGGLVVCFVVCCTVLWCGGVQAQNGPKSNSDPMDSEELLFLLKEDEVFLKSPRENVNSPPSNNDNDGEDENKAKTACVDSGGNAACEALNDNRICIEDANTDDKYRCDCKQGYKLQNDKCHAKTACVDSGGNAACEALNDNRICIEDANTDDKYRCDCKQGYKLQNDKCHAKTACVDSGGNAACEALNDNRICIEDANTDVKYRCDCKQGYKLQNDKCHVDTPCDSNPCPESTNCKLKGQNDYYCDCKSGYRLKTNIKKEENKDECLNPCDGITCQNGGTCKPLVTTYKCNCLSLYKGNHCETATCDGTPCKNGGKCELGMDSKTASCTCTEFYEGDTCETSKWCKNKFCGEETCTIDKNGTGICTCRDKEKYFNYARKVCFKIPECVSKGCQKNENCNTETGKCECLSGFKNDTEAKMCKREKLCDPNPCYTGGECAETDIANVVKCSCPSGKLYTRSNCEDSKDLTCLLPSSRSKCETACPGGMERQSNGACKQRDTTCNKNCGEYGHCYKSGETEECRCEDHKYITQDGENCVLNGDLCPGGKLTKNKKKCDCQGKFTYSSNKVTCERKTCSDKDVQQECEKLGAVCVDNWHSEDGYKCECPTGYATGYDGKCTDECSTQKKRLECAQSNQFCFLNENGKGQCTCPPGFHIDNCQSPYLKSSTYAITNLPVLKEKYMLSGGIVDFTKLSKDIIAAMTQTYQNLQFSRLYDYKVSNDVLNCTVWLQFAGEAKSDYMRIKYQARALNKENILPPSLPLKADKMKEVQGKEMLKCAGVDNDPICDGLKCEGTTCSCQPGFEIIESTYKKYGDEEFYKCQDIDECAKGTDNCPANTKCQNTKGSFYCKCNPGFKLKNADTPETENKEACIGACDAPNPCNKGTCSLNKLKMVDCSCQEGAGGSYCDRKDINFAGATKKTVVVGAVLGTLLGVIIILIVLYVFKQKKNSYSEDFAPSPRIDNAEMLERRPVRGGVSNRAYQ